MSNDNPILKPFARALPPPKKRMAEIIVLYVTEALRLYKEGGGIVGPNTHIALASNLEYEFRAEMYLLSKNKAPSWSYRSSASGGLGVFAGMVVEVSPILRPFDIVVYDASLLHFEPPDPFFDLELDTHFENENKIITKRNITL